MAGRPWGELTEAAVPDANARSDASASRRAGAFRYYLVALSLYYVVVAIVGFTPSYVDFAAGKFPIALIVHAHGLLMAAWLALFVAQTTLAATGNIAYHRALGLNATVLAALVWVSMWVMSWTGLAKGVFPADEFLLDVLLAQLGVIVLFPLFFVSAFLQRGKPEIHRRLMIFSAAILLQPAVDRMQWIDLGLPGFWGNAVLLYVIVLLPIFVFDVLSIGRLHRITLMATSAIVVFHVTISLLAGTPGWRALAYDITAPARQSGP